MSSPWTRLPGAVVGLRSVAGASASWLCVGGLLAVMLNTIRGIDHDLAMAGGSDSRQIVRSPDGAIRALTWSPDGKTLAISGGGSRVRLWDSVSGATRSIEIDDPTPNPTIISLAWSPDGRTLEVGSHSGSITQWDVEIRERLTARTFGGSEIRAFVRSANRRTQAVGLVEDGIEVRELAEGRSRRLGGPSERLHWSLALSPDGRNLVSTGRYDVLRSWDLATGDLRFEAITRAYMMIGVVYSPDGKTFVTGGMKGPLQVWDASSGQELRTIGPDTGGHNAMAFSPEGRWLAASRWDGQIRIWEAATGWEQHCLKDPDRVVNALAWSPEGRSLASGSVEGTVRLWDMSGLPTLARSEP